MDEYILRSEILKHKRLMEGFDWDGNFRDAAVLVEDILKIPAADVTPVRHGSIIETIEDGRMKRVFSCCGTDFTEMTCWMAPNYCPNCGARMDERNE